MVANNLAKNKLTLVQGISLLIATLVATTLLYRLLLRTIVNVPLGEVGIKENIDKSSDQLLLPGVHWINPLDNVVLVSTQIRNLTETIDLMSKEGINLKVDVNLQYHINPETSAEFYQKIGNNEKEVILSRISSLIRQVAVNYDLKAIYGNQRELISNKLNQSIKSELEPLGLVVDKVNLQKVVLPETIASSLQEQFVAEQNAEKRRIEAKGLVDSQKMLQALVPQKTVINLHNRND